jgi:hypothetical protein
VIGGKSRLRVHGVPKVFTKSLPPEYLHPKTAGSERIHLKDCSCFLNIDKYSGNQNSSSSVNYNRGGKNKTDINENGLETNDRSSDDNNNDLLKEDVVPLKKQKCYGLDKEIDNDKHLKSTDAWENTDKAEEEVCQCGSLSVIEETRLLRFIQTTRINVNVRQVYSVTPTTG